MLSRNGVDFYPQNEGEEATYTFNFTPYFNVESGEILSIMFPEEFPLEIG